VVRRNNSCMVCLRCQAIAAGSEAATDVSCRLSHQNCIGSAMQASIFMAAARGIRSPRGDGDAGGSTVADEPPG